MDIAFALDLSGSIDTVYNIVMALAEAVVQGLPLDSGDRTRVSVITFSDDAIINFNLDTYQTKQEVLNALSFQKACGRTNIQAALNLAYASVFTSGGGDRTGVDNRLILVTDGRSNVEETETSTQADNVKGNDIGLYVVAVGEEPDMGEVTSIASDPDSEYVLRIETPDDVETVASVLLNYLCA